VNIGGEGICFTNDCYTNIRYRTATSTTATFTVTGVTSDTVATTVTIPANSMGRNGYTHVQLWGLDDTATAASATITIKFGGTSVCELTTFTADRDFYMDCMIINNGTGSQRAKHVGGDAENGVNEIDAITTASIDTTAATTVSINATPNDTGDIISFQLITVETVFLN